MLSIVIPRTHNTAWLGIPRCESDANTQQRHAVSWFHKGVLPWLSFSHKVHARASSLVPRVQYIVLYSSVYVARWIPSVHSYRASAILTLRPWSFSQSPNVTFAATLNLEGARSCLGEPGFMMPVSLVYLSLHLSLSLSLDTAWVYISLILTPSRALHAGGGGEKPWQTGAGGVGPVALVSALHDVRWYVLRQTYASF